MKIYKGGLWNSLSEAGSQGINLVLLFFLAAILGPRNFGLIGMVTVISGFLSYFSEFGLISAIIQKKDIDEVDINTSYWSGIFLSIILYIFAYFLSPLVAKFYNQPELILIMKILFLDFLIKPFAFVQWALESKSLRYKKIALSQLTSIALSGLLAVALAFMDFGVWSLVVQQISRNFIMVVMLNLQVKWRPKFLFSFNRCKKLLRFGLNMTIHNVIRFCSENIDYLLVGKLLNPTALGIYTFAFKFSRYPLEKLWNIIGKILFPAFSTFQDNIERLKNNLLRISMFGGIVIIPVLTLLFFGIEPVILILGKKWLDSIPLMTPIIRIFIIYIIILSLSFGDESLMIAINKLPTLNIIKSISAICLLLVGYALVKMFGLIGMGVAYSIVSIAYTLFLKHRLLNYLKIGFLIFIVKMKFIYIYTLLLFVLSAVFYYLLNNKIPDIFFLIGNTFLIIFILSFFIFKFRLIDFNKKDVNLDSIIILD